MLKPNQRNIKGDNEMATKKTEPIADKLSVYETALKLIAQGDAMNKNDYSIQIAQKALQE